MKVACLHTDATFPLIYERAKREERAVDFALEHHVRTDLLGEVNHRYRGRVFAHGTIVKQLLALRQNADMVLVTSTALAMSLGEAWFSARSGIVDVDAALTRQILQVQGRVVVLCATPAAAMAVQYRFAARDIPPVLTVEVRMSQGAYAALKQDDHRKAVTQIMADTDAAYRQGADVVAIPETAMVDAAILSGLRTTITAPSAALMAALITRRKNILGFLRDRDV